MTIKSLLKFCLILLMGSSFSSTLKPASMAEIRAARMAATKAKREGTEPATVPAPTPAPAVARLPAPARAPRHAATNFLSSDGWDPFGAVFKEPTHAPASPAIPAPPRPPLSKIARDHLGATFSNKEVARVETLSVTYTTEGSAVGDTISITIGGDTITLIKTATGIGYATDATGDGSSEISIGDILIATKDEEPILVYSALRNEDGEIEPYTSFLGVEDLDLDGHSSKVSVSNSDGQKFLLQSFRSIPTTTVKIFDGEDNFDTVSVICDAYSEGTVATVDGDTFGITPGNSIVYKIEKGTTLLLSNNELLQVSGKDCFYLSFAKGPVPIPPLPPAFRNRISRSLSSSSAKSQLREILNPKDFIDIMFAIDSYVLAKKGSKKLIRAIDDYENETDILTYEAVAFEVQKLTAALGFSDRIPLSYIKLNEARASLGLKPLDAFAELDRLETPAASPAGDAEYLEYE